MALAGYNPNTSLLPSGSGPIQAMSGGGMGTPPPGFNASQSLLPPAGGSINAFSGGFLNEPIRIIGGDNKPTGLAEDKTKTTSTSFEVTWTNKVADVKYTATATPKVAPPATPAPAAPPNAPKPINGTLDATQPRFTFSGLTPKTTYTVVISAQEPIPTVAATASTPPTARLLISQPLEVTTSDTNSSSGTGTGTGAGTSAGINKDKEPKTKIITLFGETITLDNPKLLTDENFIESQKKALEAFGLDGPGLSFTKKREVVQALFDGQCNTDQPLIFKRNCEPVRQIVQNLALTLLSKIGPPQNANISKLDPDEIPEVKLEKDASGALKVSLQFKPGKSQLLSKFGVKSGATGATGASGASGASGKGAGEGSGAGAGPVDITPIIDEAKTVKTATTITINLENVLDGVTYSATIKKNSGPTTRRTTAISTINPTTKIEKGVITFSNLPSSTEFAISVIATKDKEVKSKDITATTTKLPTGDITPTQLIASGIEKNKFTITWSNNKSDVTYTIQAIAPDGITKIDGKLAADKKSATFEGLQADTAYKVVVTAEKGGVKKEGSLPVTTAKDEPPPPPASIKPTNPVSSNVTKDSFTITWNKIDVNPPSYIAKATATGDTPIKGNVTDNTAKFTGLKSGTEYQVVITASKDGKSEDSDPLKVTTIKEDGSGATDSIAPKDLRAEYDENTKRINIIFTSDTKIQYTIAATFDGKNVQVSTLNSSYFIKNPPSGKYIITVTATKDGKSDEASTNYTYPPVEEKVQKGGYDLITTKGINNNANTYCYAISTFQMLFSIPEIRSAILQYNCTKEITDESITKLVTSTGNSDVIKQKVESGFAQPPDFNAVIDMETFFCVFKKVFTLLNENTTTFEALKSTEVGGNITKGDAIPMIYMQYFIKVWAEYQNKQTEELNKKKKPSETPLPLFNKEQQQDATEFLQQFIIPIFESQAMLKDVVSIFNSRLDTKYECEAKKGSNGNPLTWTTINSEYDKIITLKPYEYITNKTKPVSGSIAANWQTKIDEKQYIELDKLVEFNQTPESVELKKCGTDGKDGATSKKPIYSIPSMNKYLLFTINRGEIIEDTKTIGQAKSRYDPNLNILANPTLVVGGKTYHLFGSVLYNPGGEAEMGSNGKKTGKTIQSRTISAGHYLYDRFYIADDETPEPKSLPNNLPFVLYNDSSVLYKNTQASSIDNKSYLIVYRLVPGQTDFAPDIPEIPNNKCQKIVQQWLDKLETAGTDITQITDEQKQFLVNTNPGQITMDEINACLQYYKTMEGLPDEVEEEKAPNLKCNAIVRSWLERSVSDKTKIKQAEIDNLLKLGGVTKDELDSCIAYFKSKGENIGFPSNGDEEGKKEEKAPNLKCNAIVRSWLERSVSDKTKIKQAEIDNLLKLGGVTKDELDSCIAYFKSKGENIGFPSNGDEEEGEEEGGEGAIPENCKIVEGKLDELEKGLKQITAERRAEIIVDIDVDSKRINNPTPKLTDEEINQCLKSLNIRITDEQEYTQKIDAECNEIIEQFTEAEKTSRQINYNRIIDLFEKKYPSRNTKSEIQEKKEYILLTEIEKCIEQKGYTIPLRECSMVYLILSDEIKESKKITNDQKAQYLKESKDFFTEQMFDECLDKMGIKLENAGEEEAKRKANEEAAKKAAANNKASKGRSTNEAKAKIQERQASRTAALQEEIPSARFPGNNNNNVFQGGKRKTQHNKKIKTIKQKLAKKTAKRKTFKKAVLKRKRRTMKKHHK